MTSKDATDSFAGLHQQIVSHWQALRSGAGLPRRGDLNIGLMRHWLANLSLVGFDAAGRGNFLLTGSHLRHVLGFEARGVMLNALDGLCPRAWQEGLRLALTEARPVGGFTHSQGRVQHAWLRLPLRADPTGSSGDVASPWLVLCHDIYCGTEVVTASHDDLFDMPESAAFTTAAAGSPMLRGLAA
jgi:hypothetical protein